MGGFENSETCEHADYHGYEGLHIVIDTDHGGAEHLLCLHGENVAEEGANHYHESCLEPCAKGDGGKRYGGYVGVGEWGDDECRKGEHPLVYGEDGIAFYQAVEHRQIEGEGELGEHAEEVATNVANFGVVGCRAGEDEHERSAETHEHSAGFLSGDGLLENDGGENHGEDGHGGGHYAGVDG